MLFHLSIPTDNPERVAKVIAELWRGEAFPFFPHRNSSWVAFAGDERGTGIECYPRDVLITPSDEEQPTGFTLSPLASEAGETHKVGGYHRSATHAAIATPLSIEELIAIGAREGWLTRYARRGVFGVVEMWIENSIMFELLPPEQQKEYLSTQTLNGWRTVVAAIAARQRLGGAAAWGDGPPPEPAASEG